jgi:hypothetical protein
VQERLVPILPHREAIDQHLQVVGARLVQLDLVADVNDLPVDPQAAEAFAPDVAEQVRPVLAVDLADRRADLDHGALRQRQHVVHDLRGVRTGTPRPHAGQQPSPIVANRMRR